MKSKKILLYTRPIIPPWDEASKNLAYEISRFCGSFFEIHLLSTKNSDFTVENDQCPIIMERIFSSSRLRTIEKIQLLFRLFRPRLNADIIHFLFSPRALTSRLIRTRLKFSKTKTIQTVATIAAEAYADTKKLSRVFFADQIIAQSIYTKNKLLKAGFTNVNFIYPGIDLEKFKPASKDNDLMKKLGITQNDLTFLFAGEFTRIRGIDDIIEAFGLIDSKFKNSQKNYKLIIACRIKSPADQIKRKTLEKTVEKMRLTDTIIFYDNVKDMPTLYNISDAQIFYVREMTGKVDIPYALIEPMACGKPIIVSDLPVLTEITNKNAAGITIATADSQSLAKCLIDLINNPQQLKKMGEEALSFIQENFDIRKNVKEYEKIYKRLAA